ncbi:unnamed protein product [Rotaria sp. Silwood1]|nr:unnamed protein product [Rotaria sp. Silwood1]CAF1664630.1 unnamed protein product [Rotaria sp. Silwood1]CAF3420820.1 unnamed protein product [Rotaria sp. Silwood1]CAF3846583.1 unnamed protein product [Rotaria sp. Silwood1]CAF4876375.1 unnamed protein product [Rotaria sp. Silwood1]
MKSSAIFYSCLLPILLILLCYPVSFRYTTTIPIESSADSIFEFLSSDKIKQLQPLVKEHTLIKQFNSTHSKSYIIESVPITINNYNIFHINAKSTIITVINNSNKLITNEVHSQFNLVRLKQSFQIKEDIQHSSVNLLIDDIYCETLWCLRSFTLKQIQYAHNKLLENIKLKLELKRNQQGQE